MLKKILLATLFLSSFVSSSQEVVNSTPIELKKNPDIFQTVNNDKKEVTLFISDKIKVKAIHLNEKMQVADSISTERPDTKTYANMIGYNINNNNTRLFWSSNDYKSVFTQLYDFNNHTVNTQQYSLILENEKVLQKFSENENFYILTVLKKSNIFKLHIFDKNGSYTEKTISLENFHFYKSNYTKSDLYGILGENLLPFEAPFSLQKITVENPTSLTDAAKKRKCYFNKKQIIITIDTNVDYTQAIIIDLGNFSATEKIIRSVSVSNTDRSGNKVHLNSNSFFIDDKLFQIKSSSNSFYFTIKDLDNNLLKEYSVTGDAPIDFKNSEIIQEGSDFATDKRILENSSQFIRKINNLNSGIACYHLGKNTLITFGGVSAAQQSSGQIALGQFGLIGALVSVAVFNPTMESFNSYANRKVVKIEGLFDNDGNHIKNELQPLAFDKIRTFFDQNNNVSSQTLFKANDNYHLGYYDNKTKEYIIRKFID